jgi:ribonuclease J
MNICIHRGSRQIGGSCVELEQNGQRIILDLGLPLDVESNDESYLPDIRGLDGSDSYLLGIFLSHSHLDHTGLIKHISPGIPVGMGEAARRIMDSAAPFLPDKFPLPPEGWNYQTRKAFKVGPFRITPFLMDHSAYDAYALLIEAGGKRLFYSGDFRSHGRKAKLFENIVKNPPRNIDILLMEGTCLGRLDQGQHHPTEYDVEQKLTQIFLETQGLAMVQASAQNIDRIVSIMKASKRAGRIMLIDLYTAVVLEATENKNIPQSHWPEIALFVPHSQRIKIKNNAWFDQLKHHSTNRIFMELLQKNPNKYTLLFRPLHIQDLERGQCLDNSVYVYSQWEGYWERGDYDKVKDWINEKKIPKQSVHTSGHASPADLQKFVKALSPLKVVPIHSSRPERFPELFPSVEFHNDGDWWEA